MRLTLRADVDGMLSLELEDLVNIVAEEDVSLDLLDDDEPCS